MPCGDRCKQILDGGAAVKRAVNCMTNTVLLRHAGDKGPSADLAKEHQAAAEKYARLCADVEASFTT